jgi:hypothetical protein
MFTMSRDRPEIMIFDFLEFLLGKLEEKFENFLDLPIIEKHSPNIVDKSVLK